MPGVGVSRAHAHVLEHTDMHTHTQAYTRTQRHTHAHTRIHTHTQPPTPCPTHLAPMCVQPNSGNTRCRPRQRHGTCASYYINTLGEKGAKRGKQDKNVPPAAAHVGGNRNLRVRGRPARKTFQFQTKTKKIIRMDEGNHHPPLASTTARAATRVRGRAVEAGARKSPSNRNSRAESFWILNTMKPAAGKAAAAAAAAAADEERAPAASESSICTNSVLITPFLAGSVRRVQ